MEIMNKKIVLIVLLVLIGIVFGYLGREVSSVSGKTIPITPPNQPELGPGGADYRHTEVIKNRYGQGDDEYWIFEPISPAPASAPLVVFNHGWGGMDPKAYGAWIEHIGRYP